MMYSWRKKNEQPSHADDWLMTYADMITLLLCFFAIFLSISVPKKETQQAVQVQPPAKQIEQDIKKATDKPDLLEGNLPFYGLPHAVDTTVYWADEAATTKSDGYILAVKPDHAEPIKPPDAVNSSIANSSVVPPPVTLPQIVDHLKTRGDAHIEQKGDRITTIEMSSGAFFDKGSATMSKEGRAILKDVAVNLKSDQYKDYTITVEGHTDDVPIATLQFPSNWELSTARAAAVVHGLLDEGIAAQKLRAAGYADTFPKAPNRAANGNAIAANQAQNRRVVIKLEKIEKEKVE